MSLIPKPKAVLFDWNRTLVKSSISPQASRVDAIALNLDTNKLSNPKQDREADFDKILPQKETLLPGALELLELLYQDKVPMSVISNEFGSVLRQKIKALGLGHYFYQIIGSNDTYRNKPAPDSAHLALIGLNLEPYTHEIWLIGDGLADMQCAKNCGCLPILIGNDQQVMNEVVRAGIKVWPILDHHHLIKLYQRVVSNASSTTI